jgi:hypothetical protein
LFHTISTPEFFKRNSFNRRGAGGQKSRVLAAAFEQAMSMDKSEAKTFGRNQGYSGSRAFEKGSGFF